MHRSTLVPALVPAVLTAALLLTGCGVGDTPDAAPPAADGTSASPEHPASPESPASTTPAADPTGEPPGGEVTSSDVPEPAGSPAAGGTGAPVVWPDEATPVHGSRVWAVYLAVGSPDSDGDRHMLGEAASYARGLGYAGSGIGEVSCDQGAAEALGLDPADHRVAVYFPSSARAQEFVAVYDRQDVGSAQVTTYCLD